MLNATATELRDLAGWELGAVCFVTSYAEFHFNGPILRSLAPPILLVGEERFAFPDTDSRDALCGLIGLVVERAADEPDQLLVHFAGGARLHVPKASEGAGPEVAHFVPMIDGQQDVVSMKVWENLLPGHHDA